MRSSPNCSHSVIPPLASRFRKKHGVFRWLSLRWLQCLVPSMETRRMVQPPIPGVCTSQGPSRQRKHTAVTVARLSQRKTIELSLRILAEWFLNRSGYCCEIHYTKVLMHRQKIDIKHSSEHPQRGNFDAAAPSASDGFLVLKLSSLH